MSSEKVNLVKSIIQSNRDKLPIISAHWNVNDFQKKQQYAFIEVCSKRHSTHALKIQNFYKPLIPLLNITKLRSEQEKSI